MKSKNNDSFVANFDFDDTSFTQENQLENTTEEHIVTHHLGTNFAVNCIVKLNKKVPRLTKNDALKDVDFDTLISILSDAQQLSASVRTAINELDIYLSDEQKKRRSTVSNILVSEPENAILRISLPPLIGRVYKGSYDIYWATKQAISDYLGTRELGPFFNEKLVLIYKKYAPDLTVDFTCDNDNWEMKRTTNAISECIHHSDNANNFSFIYTAVVAPVSYVEATVIRIQDLPLFCEYISSTTPAQPVY